MPKNNCRYGGPLGAYSRESMIHADNPNISPNPNERPQYVSQYSLHISRRFCVYSSLKNRLVKLLS